MNAIAIMKQGFKSIGGAVSLFAVNLVVSGSSQALPFDYIEFLPAYTHVATACTIDEADTSSYTYNLGSLGVPTGLGFIANSTDLNLYAWCNIANPLDEGNPEWNGLIVGFRDPDGTDAKARVRAYLYRVSRVNGVQKLLATFDSNVPSGTNFVQNTFNWQEGFTVLPSRTFNFFQYEYFVMLHLSRKTTAPVQYPVVTKFRLAEIQKSPG